MLKTESLNELKYKGCPKEIREALEAGLAIHGKAWNYAEDVKEDCTLVGYTGYHKYPYEMVNNTYANFTPHQEKRSTTDLLVLFDNGIVLPKDTVIEVRDFDTCEWMLRRLSQVIKGFVIAYKEGCSYRDSPGSTKWLQGRLLEPMEY